MSKKFNMASETVLSYYWGLASTNEDERLKAGFGLINSLIEAQNEHIKQGNSSDTLCTDLDYSLNRLSKGLASSRKGARQGFATVLTEILSQFDNIKTEHIMELLEKCLQVTGNAKSQEERDAYIGHIFGLMAIVKSNCLTEKTKPSECEWLPKVVTTLKQLSDKKSYIKELCVKSIADVISLVSFDVFKEQILPVISDDIFSGWSKATPESLFLALFVQRRFGKQFHKKAFRKAWITSSIIDAQNYSKMPNILQDTTNSHPNVHCVWDELLLQIYQEECNVNFKQFWNIVIDNGLFISSHGKKYLGFSLIAKILHKLKVNQVPIVFSKNIVKSLINNLSSNQNYLHSAAKHLASSMPNALSLNEDPDVTAFVVHQLLGKQGNIQFDKLTKTRTVELLLGKLEGSGLERVVTWLIDCFKAGCTNASDNERPSEREVDFIRISILNQVLSLGKNKNLCQSGEWMQKLLFFLIETTYFEKTEEKDILLYPLSKQVKDVSEQRLLSFIKELSSHTGQDRGKISSKSNEEQTWILTILKHIKKLLETSGFAVSTPNWSDKTKKSFDSALKLVTKIYKKHKDDIITAEDEAFELLLSHMTLQLFVDPEQASEILDEIKSCYKNRQNKEKGIETDEPLWVEVLTEILLSLLTRPSNLLRHVVHEVFTAIAPHLTKDAFHIIVQAVDPRNHSGDDQLEVEEGSDDDQMERESEEEIDKNGTEGDINDHSGSSDDDDESDVHNDDADVDEEFKAAVKAALGDAAVNDDSKEREEEDLDDEAMQKFDEAMAVVCKFKAKGTQEKKNKKDKSKAILHFKLRVLDIIEIFIKKQQSNPLILNLIEPLLSVIWSTINSKDYGTLGERAQGIFKNKLCALKEQPAAEDIDRDEVHSLLENLLQKSMSAPSLNLVTLITKGCMLLIRVLKGKPLQSTTPSKKRKHKDDASVAENIGHVDVSRVAGMFKVALKDFMEKRTTHLHPVLFIELINRYQFLAWEIAPELAKAISVAVNNFRKMQACLMLTKLLSHSCIPYENHIVSIAPHLQQTLKLILEDTSKENTSMKAKHFKEVLKLMSKFIKEVESLQLEHLIEKELLVTLLQKSLDGALATRSQDIKSCCNKIIVTLNSSKGTDETSSKNKKKKEQNHSNGNDTESPDLTKIKHKEKRKKKARQTDE